MEQSEVPEKTVKSRILEAALALFASKGYESTGVQEIVEKSGITKPTMYYYFKSKRGLLEFLIQQHGDKMFERIAAVSEYKHDFIKHLTSILIEICKIAQDDSDFFRLHYTLSVAAVKTEGYIVHKPFQNRLDGYFFNLFTLCTAEFGNMKGYEGLFSRMFQSVIEKTALDFLNGNLIINDDTIYRIIRAFIYGVAN